MLISFRNNLNANHLSLQIDFESAFLLKADTINENTNPSSTKENAIKNSSAFSSAYANESINFLINSSISYFSFANFIDQEALNSYFRGWLKEKEWKKIIHQNDSLRKVYVLSSDEQKIALSTKILQNEQKSFALNNEFEELYQFARRTENSQWEKASADDIAQFQKKMKNYADSINHLQLIEKENSVESEDTLIFEYIKKEVAIKEAAEAAEIVYKIQIGAFKGKVPETNKQLIKKLSLIRKVENHVDEKGLTIYTTGNLKTMEEAESLKNQLKQEGVKNPIVLAFRKGIKIETQQIVNP
jgi:hypothetical protein